MSERNNSPIEIAPRFYQLGSHSFPAYLSLGDDGMIIEGGTSATYDIIVKQVEELGIEPERIKYLTLTHTHSDHIGALPYLKKLWPHLNIVGSPVAVKLLNRLMEKERALNEFLSSDRSIAEILYAKGEIDELPPAADDYTFGVDTVVQEGDSIDLGAGVVWNVYDTPGHSPCHISFYDENEGILMVGDATGFHEPEGDIFWPNYFESLKGYCDSIRKLASLPARNLALCHNGVVDGEDSGYFRRALEATEAYHLEIMERLDKGDDPEQIALDKAKWVTTFTALIPFEGIKGLVSLTIRRSQDAAGKENLFTIP